MENVKSVCNTVRNNSKHGTNFQKLLVSLRREFKAQGFELSIKSTRDKKLEPEEFYVNAFYDPIDDKDGDVPVEVVVHHNFPVDAEWDKAHVTELLIQVFDAVVHEYKHQRQSRKRNHKIYWHQTVTAYLDDPDEIDAYSLSIAVELCRNLGKYRAIRYMSRLSALSRFKIQDKYVSPNLFTYVLEFGPAHPIIKELSKKVYVRLQKVDVDVIFV
jgi:hypothetical protein